MMILSHKDLDDTSMDKLCIKYKSLRQERSKLTDQIKSGSSQQLIKNHNGLST